MGNKCFNRDGGSSTHVVDLRDHNNLNDEMQSNRTGKSISTHNNNNGGKGGRKRSKKSGGVMPGTTSDPSNVFKHGSKHIHFTY